MSNPDEKLYQCVGYAAVALPKLPGEQLCIEITRSNAVTLGRARELSLMANSFLGSNTHMSLVQPIEGKTIVTRLIIWPEGYSQE